MCGRAAQGTPDLAQGTPDLGLSVRTRWKGAGADLRAGGLGTKSRDPEPEQPWSRRAWVVAGRGS